jgi:hypothetical protein
MSIIMNRIYVVLFFLCLFYSFSGQSSVSQNPDDIAVRIFLGQFYPSGHIYLKPFPLPRTSQSEDDYLKSFSWPVTISFHALSSIYPDSNKIMEAHLSSIMHDGKHELQKNTYQLESAYIPSLESMDDSHEGCTKKFYKPRNAHYQYRGGDFFYQALFNCNPNEGVAIYKNNDSSNLSYSVIAFAKDLDLYEIRFMNGERRPLTSDELVAVEKEKMETKKIESERTTIPTYLDSAVSYLSARVKGSDMSIRISQYETAGRMGHLAKVFILDVVKSGVLLKKYELAQYLGAI